MPLAVVALLLGMAVSSTAAPKIQVHGHRGARAVQPENSLPAFEYAIASGADVLELDMAVTKDNVLVVSHDQKMDRKLCRGPEGETAIHKMTLEQVRQWDCGVVPNKNFPKQKAIPGTKVPTLDEVFALAPRGTFGFNIETKMGDDDAGLNPDPATFAKLVVETVHKHGLTQRVIVQSFDYRTLAEVRKLDPQIRLSALYAGLPKDFTTISKDAGGAPFVSPHHLLVTQAKVKSAHKAGLQVVPWTANTPGAWDRLIKAQVDAIITDDPAALIDYLKSKGLR